MCGILIHIENITCGCSQPRNYALDIHSDYAEKSDSYKVRLNLNLTTFKWLHKISHLHKVNLGFVSEYHIIRKLVTITRPGS